MSLLLTRGADTGLDSGLMSIMSPPSRAEFVGNPWIGSIFPGIPEPRFCSSNSEVPTKSHSSVRLS